MTVYLDDQKVQLEGSNLGAVLVAAKNDLDPAGRIVVEVQLDGQSLIGDDLANKQDHAVEGCELRLYSADPKQLGIAALEQVRAALDEAREHQSQAAELLQQDRSADAMEGITEAFDIWRHVQQAVMQSAALVGLSLEELEFEGKPFADLTEALITQLKDLREVLESHDMVALADVLAYEWPQTVDAWQAMIGKIVSSIEET